MRGTRFRHLYVRKPGWGERSELRVYLGGDGGPWVGERWIARDPTARDPMAAKLLLRDPGPALYLGRPCYHQVDTDAPLCDPRLWTSARYGEAVVDSMAAALQRLLGGAREVTLVGYSGGGVLGMLLAQRLDAVVGVVTVAANLDTDAWTQLHGYSPLSSSFNPAREPPLAPGIWQLHLAGADDKQVPPALIEHALRGERHAELAVVRGFDHHCCWNDIWPAVIDALQTRRDTCPQLEKVLPDVTCRAVAAWHR